LPGVDDGAKTIDETLEMLKSAIDEGITVITASPHHNPEYHNQRSGILEKVAEINQLITENQLPIQVLPGQEVRIYGELLEDYQAGKLVTSADLSHYMLVEFPTDHVPRYADKLFYEMNLQGLQPILVHPERNVRILEEPNLLYNFVAQGVLSQVTASSLTGHFGKKIQKLSFQIIENNLTHFIASDAHNTTTRTFKMKNAFELIAKKYSSSLADEFKENAEKVIKNEALYPPAASKIKSKRFINLFK
jgi:protein-tyrosine phosphatase